jgi:CMP-N-acetylneuraminic acid synthetase
MSVSITGIIPARAGSIRVPNKNKLMLEGHPIVAYTIESARQSGAFSKLILATDDNEIIDIGIHYGVDEVFKRDFSDSSSTSLDIEWLTNLYTNNRIDTEYFAILRPTSPQRSVKLIRDCVSKYLDSACDSLRTMSLVQEHPGKMWRVDGGGKARPFLSQRINQPASHALQYGSLETLYVQTSVLEIARTDVIVSTKTREGKSICGFLTSGVDSFAIDTPNDLAFLEFLISKNTNILPKISIKPFRSII